MNNQDILDKLLRAKAVLENYGMVVEDLIVGLSVTKETFSRLKDELGEAEASGGLGLKTADGKSTITISHPAEPHDYTKMPTVEDYLKKHYGDNPPPKKKKRKQ